MDEEMERARAPKVKQLLPADGWLAAMASMEGRVTTTPLIGWALVEQQDEDADLGEVLPWSGQAVVGVYLDGGRYPEVPTRYDFFLGYARSEDEAQRFAGDAMAYAEKMKKEGR